MKGSTVLLACESILLGVMEPAVEVGAPEVLASKFSFEPELQWDIIIPDVSGVSSAVDNSSTFSLRELRRENARALGPFGALEEELEAFCLFLSSGSLLG